MPSHSSALVIFHHPSGETARLNRYAWVNAKRPEASDPGTRLDELSVTGSLDPAGLARLFGKSHPIETARPSYIVS